MPSPKFIQVSTPHLIDTPEGPRAMLYKGQAAGKTEALAVLWLAPADKVDVYPSGPGDAIQLADWRDRHLEAISAALRLPSRPPTAANRVDMRGENTPSLSD